MKRITNVFVISISLLALLASSCQTGSKDGFSETDTGLKYKFHYLSGDTTAPAEGMFIDIMLVLRTSDSVLFDGRNISDEDRSPIPMSRPLFEGDIFEGLAMMNEGDSATFAVNADSVWKLMYQREVPPKGLETAEYVYYDIKLKEVLTRDEMNSKMEAREQQLYGEELTARTGYLAENYPAAEPMPSGLYYIRTQQGKGKSPVEGQLVQVHYTGRLLDGTQFDSSEGRDPIEFPLGKGRVIKGWDEGIANMKKGEKGILIIPSELGYGKRGSGRIPPFSTLVFEVELVDFKDAEE